MQGLEQSANALQNGDPKWRKTFMLHVDWVGVGWERHSIICRSLPELDNQGAVFVCFCFF